jgi:hypothetical protein
MTVFDPVDYSLAENKWLREAIGKPPVVAAGQIPQGVNPKAVLPVVQRVYELEQLKTHENQDWCGVVVLQKSIDTYIEQATKWANDRRRGRVRFPSLASYDSRGRAHRGATGADSTKVRTFFDEKGKRQHFEVELIPNETPYWVAPSVSEDASTAGILNNEEKHRIECTVCNHTESYNPDKGRSSYGAARARMSKHLRTAKDEVDAHREIYTLEFGG